MAIVGLPVMAGGTVLRENVYFFIAMTVLFRTSEQCPVGRPSEALRHRGRRMRFLVGFIRIGVDDRIDGATSASLSLAKVKCVRNANRAQYGSVMAGSVYSRGLDQYRLLPTCWGLVSGWWGGGS